MIITPAKFEDTYNAISKKTINKPEDLVGAVCLQSETFELFCDTLDSLGYDVTIKRIKEELDKNSNWRNSSLWR